MGFFDSLISATVNTVLTPIAVVKDAVNVVVGEEPNATKKHVEKITGDVESIFEEF